MDEQDSRTLVRIMIDIAEQLDYRIIAEGVETEAQCDILAGLSPQIYCQGFLYSHPLPADDFRALVQAHNGGLSPSTR